MLSIIKHPWHHWLGCVQKYKIQRPPPHFPNPPHSFSHNFAHLLEEGRQTCAQSCSTSITHEAKFPCVNLHFNLSLNSCLQSVCLLGLELRLQLNLGGFLWGPLVQITNKDDSICVYKQLKKKYTHDSVNGVVWNITTLSTCLRTRRWEQSRELCEY